MVIWSTNCASTELEASAPPFEVLACISGLLRPEIGTFYGVVCLRKGGNLVPVSNATRACTNKSGGIDAGIATFGLMHLIQLFC